MKKLGEDLYVDDTRTGCNSVEEGKTFHEVAVKVMNEAGFDLRKRFTNDNELQRFFNERRLAIRQKVMTLLSLKVRSMVWRALVIITC